MQGVYDKLRTLQDILARKYEVEKEILEIPKIVTTKIELLNRLKRIHQDKINDLEEIKERISKLRGKLSEAELRREAYEKQMDMIKTQREYEALDKEIKDATEKEQNLRKDILRDEKEYEELTIALERDLAMIKQQEEELQIEQDKIKSEKSEKEEYFKQLSKEEREIIPDLDEEILFKFERIIRSKSGLGIVPVRRSVCTGCHMILPAQFENDVRTGENILFCPYCSRILFYSEEEDSSFAFGEEEVGSLADLDFFNEDDIDEEE